MKKITITILCIIQFGLVSTNLKAKTQTKHDNLHARIDSYLNASESNGFSGSILVVKKGNIILSKGYGWSDRKNKIPVTSSSVFNIGSITKQFTATGILKLIEQGKIRTSDKISQFFDQVPSDKKDITIHQLLTHTSGISPRTGGFRYDEAENKSFLNEFFESELNPTTKIKHQYANANYILLSAIIELVSKQEYTDFLYENLWKPANMTATGYKKINFNSVRLAHGYYYDDTKGSWNDWGTTQEHLPLNNNHWYSIGKGDIHSSTEDLYKWHLALQKNNVLNAQSREMLETPYVPENSKETSHYGYGWAIFKSNRGTKIVTHDGSNGIYFSNFIRFVEEDVVIIALSNVILGQDSQNVAWHISRMVFDTNYQAKPVKKLSYELVYDFIRENQPDNSNNLIANLENNLGKKFTDKSVFNRIGSARISQEKTPDWGIELLKLNVQLFPEDGNLWDSLGGAYLAYKQTKKAIMSYKKALELTPKNNCHWCENSSKQLKELQNPALKKSSKKSSK